MAKPKIEGKVIERTYNVPLRKEYQKVPRWKRTKKAVTALRQFLQKHMKTQDVRLTTDLNQHVWKHGIKNPPHHVKVTVSKDEKGVATADLFGKKKKEDKKAPTKKEEKRAETKETKPEEKKAEEKQAPSKEKVEEKKAEEKPAETPAK